MYFAQFYTRGVISGDVIEACGDRSVIILDGRNTIETMMENAITFGRLHGWIAFSLHKGITFNRGVTSLSPTIPIYQEKK